MQVLFDIWHFIGFVWQDVTANHSRDIELFTRI